MSFLEQIKLCIYLLIILHLLDSFIIRISRWLNTKRTVDESHEGLFCEKVLNELNEEQYLQHIILYLKDYGYKDCIAEDEKTILCYDSVGAVEVLMVSSINEIEFFNFLGNIRAKGLKNIIIINKSKFPQEIYNYCESLENADVNIKLIEGDELVKALRYIKEKNILLGEVR